MKISFSTASGPIEKALKNAWESLWPPEFEKLSLFPA